MMTKWITCLVMAIFIAAPAMAQQQFMNKAREWTMISDYYYIETSAAIQQ